MADYPIIDIEGIGETYAPKLQEVGVKTVARLLERGKTPKGRKELAESTGINEKLILKWVNMGDLFRVKGIGPEYSELLEKAGVDTVKELRHRVPNTCTPSWKRLIPPRTVPWSGPCPVSRRCKPGSRPPSSWSPWLPIDQRHL